MSYHSLKANSVQVLCAIIPHDVSGTSWAGRAPVLYLGHFPSATVATILVFPLPVDTPDYAGTGEDATDGNLLGFPSRINKGPGKKIMYENFKQWMGNVFNNFS